MYWSLTTFVTLHLIGKYTYQTIRNHNFQEQVYTLVKKVVKSLIKLKWVYVSELIWNGVPKPQFLSDIYL